MSEIDHMILETVLGMCLIAALIAVHLLRHQLGRANDEAESLRHHLAVAQARAGSTWRGRE